MYHSLFGFSFLFYFLFVFDIPPCPHHQLFDVSKNLMIGVNKLRTDKDAKQ